MPKSKKRQPGCCSGIGSCIMSCIRYFYSGPSQPSPPSSSSLSSSSALAATKSKRTKPVREYVAPSTSSWDNPYSPLEEDQRRIEREEAEDRRERHRYRQPAAPAAPAAPPAPPAPPAPAQITYILHFTGSRGGPQFGHNAYRVRVNPTWHYIVYNGIREIGEINVVMNANKMKNYPENRQSEIMNNSALEEARKQYEGIRIELG